jgi:hypothetical protein
MNERDAVETAKAVREEEIYRENLRAQGRKAARFYRHAIAGHLAGQAGAELAKRGSSPGWLRFPEPNKTERLVWHESGHAIWKLIFNERCRSISILSTGAGQCGAASLEDAQATQSMLPSDDEKADLYLGSLKAEGYRHSKDRILATAVRFLGQKKYRFVLVNLAVLVKSRLDQNGEAFLSHEEVTAFIERCLGRRSSAMVSSLDCAAAKTPSRD